MMHLEPCPFCGSECHTFSAIDRDKVYVICDSDACMACGPIKDAEDTAARAWNRRPALAAAVQAEREACAQAAETAYVVDGGVGPTWRAGTQFGAENAAKAIRARGPSPTIPTVGPKAFHVEPRADRSLNVVEDSPAADVLAVVREYIDARANCDWRTDTVKRYAAASDALRALVAPRTAEESSGVEDIAKRLMGFRLVADPSIPPGEIHANVDGYTAGKIVGMDAPAKPEAREGRS